MSAKNDGVIRSSLRGINPYLWTAAAVVFCYIVFALLLKAEQGTVRGLMLAGVALCAVYWVLRCRISKALSKPEVLIQALIAAGIIMRIGYMLYTSYAERGHDISGFGDDGHLGYMYQIFSTGTLPQGNSYQFYHPPFEHIIQALVVRVFSWFQPVSDLPALFESAKLVPCYASCALLWVSRSLCRELRLQPQAAVLALAVIAFQPTFYILSASVNNDPLMLLFFLIAVLYTIRWYYSSSIKNILMIALSIGFAMMTKLSGGMAALFTAPVFIAVLIKKLRERQVKGIIGQFAAFAGVCIPLGLWYPVRNLLLFNQSLGHIAPVTSALYCGDASIAARFMSFSAEQLFTPLYCQPFEDFNIWMYTAKCSVFGEFSFGAPDVLAKLMIVANLALILVSLAAMIYVMAVCRETSRFARFGLFWIWFTQMASFIAFNLGYPLGCTMDFRYIIPTVITGAVYTGIALDHFRRKRSIGASAVFYAGCAVVVLFSIASVLFYTA